MNKFVPPSQRNHWKPLCLLIYSEKDSFSFEQLEDKEMGFCLTAPLKMTFDSLIGCL